MQRLPRAESRCSYRLDTDVCAELSFSGFTRDFFGSPSGPSPISSVPRSKCGKYGSGDCGDGSDRSDTKSDSREDSGQPRPDGAILSTVGGFPLGAQIRISILTILAACVSQSASPRFFVRLTFGSAWLCGRQ